MRMDVLRGTVPMPFSSADFSLNHQGVPGTPLFLHEGCNHNGVTALVQRVASAWQCRCYPYEASTSGNGVIVQFVYK